MIEGRRRMARKGGERKEMKYKKKIPKTKIVCGEREGRSEKGKC